MQAAQTLSAGLFVASQPSQARVAHCQDAAPQQPDQPLRGSKPWERWPVHIRTVMASTLVSNLGATEYAEVRNTGVFPRCEDHPHLLSAYAQVRKRVAEELGPITAPGPTAEAVRVVSQRWAVSLAKHGHVLDTPPHQPGYKNVGRRKEVLQQIKAAIIAGFPSANGHFYYSSVKEAMARSPQIDDWVKELGFKRPESVWKLLKQEWPYLYLGNLIMKKKRDHAQTQVCA